jgi:hypothetical protein
VKLVGRSGFFTKVEDSHPLVVSVIRKLESSRGWLRIFGHPAHAFFN